MTTGSVPAPIAAKTSISSAKIGDTLEFLLSAGAENSDNIPEESERWKLIFPEKELEIAKADKIILGRKPNSTISGSKLVEVLDESKAVSKTHALLFWQGDSWWLQDLESTNGSSVFDEFGNHRELNPGVAEAVVSEFQLAELRVKILKV